jgi:hypothetical protein
MKKTPRKLALHSETLRMLTNIDLVRAVGGIDSAENQYLEAQTGAKQCPGAAVAYETGAKQCPGAAVID